MSSISQQIKQKFAHTSLAHTPTPFEYLPHLSASYRQPEGEVNLWIKRDDCTGLGAGGNKARQLEFYLGEALAQSADTILTTGAVQSNHVRMTVAAARKLGMHCEVQFEERVPDRPGEYYNSGNPFLVHVMEPKVHTFPVGEDESGADNALYQRAEQLKAKNKTPYVIGLSPDHKPLGALGYMLAAEELLEQAADMPIDAVVLASGSGTTHSGLLMGFRALGHKTKVIGICVRRNAKQQRPRIINRCQQLEQMIGKTGLVKDEDVVISDETLAPGYGQLNNAVKHAIFTCAQQEGILLDPTYTGKAMAGLIHLLNNNTFTAGQNIVFLHTGGLPGIFGYPELLEYTLAHHQT